jgi:hypothetical protein
MDMDQGFILNLDNVEVRFTPDGKVSVIDSIQALTNASRPADLWETLKQEHPDILQYCEDYSFHDEILVPVLDIEGWAKMQEVLPDYLDRLQ